LLPDPTFSKWLSIKGLGQPDDDGDTKGVFRTANPVGAPVWSLAQWASRHSLADPAVTQQKQFDAFRFQIANPSKRVAVDCRRGEIDLGLFASACYDRPRQAGERWPHLLAQTALTDTRYPSTSCRLADMRRLDVALSCRLESFVDKNPGADPKLHAAQFQLFLVVQNLTRGDDGYGDMMWFGIPVFDNRYPVKAESYSRDGGKPDASGKFIYSLPGKICLVDGKGFFKNEKPLAGKDARWADIRVNAAPWIEYAFKLAQRNGFLRTSEFRDLYVSGLNLGWEMPGTYDAVMQVRDFSLTATPRVSPPVQPQPAVARKGARPPHSSPTVEP
jgi:hypothetical protein